MYLDIKRQFSRFDKELLPMEQPARLAKDFDAIAIINIPR